MKAIGVALAMGLAASAVYAAEVAVSMVAMGADGPQPLSERQSLWASPFGGWVVATWPFGMRVDDQPLMEFSSRRDKLLQRAATDRLDGDAALIDGLLEKTIMPEGSKEADEETRVFRFRRESSARLNLASGSHTLHPFDIVFTVGADGRAASTDPRVRIDAAARRVEVLCHPVVLRTVAVGRTQAAPLTVTLGGRSLLGGLDPVLEAAADADGGTSAQTGEHAFFRVTAYLPSSAAGKPYSVNGVAFVVGADGRVALAADGPAQCVDGREIRLAGVAGRPVAIDAAPPPREEARGSGEGAATASVSAATPHTASVSLYTARNRGLFRRGDAVDVFWCARNDAAQPAGNLALALVGRDLRVALGTVPLPRREARGLASGCLRLDTATLAPGAYEVGADVPGGVCYPLRFRVCQREPVSDYEVYSYVYGEAAPYAGSPVNAYYGTLPDGPGLTAVLKEVDASMDPALAVQANDPAGPAPEKFIRPTPEEARLMALAAMGMRAVLQYPTLLYHEDWNPKHTLPEELAQMRRRLALFVQPLADVPGLGGITMGWYATHNGGWWEDVPCQDGNVSRRNAAAAAWVKAQTGKGVPEIRAWSSLLPNAWAEYLADVRQMAPALSAHNAIPSWWLGNHTHYAPYAFETLTHRDSVCYSDYSLTAWGNFRTPAWLNMGNRSGQKLQASFFANTMQNRIVTAFGASGRGLDGFSMPVTGDIPQGEDEALLRIFERFGSWFTALDPLHDVALYCSDRNPQNVALHDLARLRRPAMLLADEDVLAGELAKYRVLFLVSAKTPPAAAILDAFKAFEAQGGIILKDRTCHASLPGRDLGFGYEGDQVHGVWGLTYANGEDEFAHLWKNFKETREKLLVAAFASIPGIAVSTADPDAVISPLAGSESICCFVVNQTLVPLSLAGRWRQYYVLPKSNELLVQRGWHVRNLLTGAPAPLTETADGAKTALDFTRMEGALFLLTRREPVGMAMRTERSSAKAVRLTGWLADAAERPIADPMPFEVTLRQANGTVLFRKFAALSPVRALEVPVPALSDGAKLELTVRDLVLGATATQALDPAPAAVVSVAATPDFVGGVDPILAFLRTRQIPVTVLLDEGQEPFRPAAEQLAALLQRHGRVAQVRVWDPADVRPLPLRWRPTAEDRAVVAGLEGGAGFASRAGLGAVAQKNPKTGETEGIRFDDPSCGYDEYGPRLRHDADIVLFGEPADSRAVAQLMPYLRRAPSASYPAAGGFFVHYLWSPFQGGYDGLYVGCRDAAGAGAAVAALEGAAAGKQASAEARPQGLEQGDPVVTSGGARAPLENLVEGRFGRAIVDLAFTPDGKRVFAVAGGLGNQLFALSSDGQVEAAREVHHRRGLVYQGVEAPLTARDDRTVDVTVGGTHYRYSLDTGFVSCWKPPAASFAGRKEVRAAASALFEDQERSLTYLGGRRLLHALDGQGRRLWSYDDEAGPMSEEELLHPRTLYPRAVSSDGRVLLVAGFGSREMATGPAQPANTVVLGLAADTGEVLWRKAMFLNEGSVVALDDGFLVVPDERSGRSDPRLVTRPRIVNAATGAEGTAPPLAGAAQLYPVPGRAELLIIDNDAFDRQGPTARAALLPLSGDGVRELPVSGRVTDARVTDDGQSVLLATARGETLRVGVADGRIVWRAETPSGGILRLAPDGSSVWVGARDGVIHRIDAATGKTLGSTDLNPYNRTTPERFVSQMDAVGEVPAAANGKTAPPAPVEPSYRTMLDPKRLPFGENLITAAQLKALLRSDAAAGVGVLALDAAFKLQVESGKTYLVELLAGAADAAQVTAQTRLEIAVSGTRQTANLPCAGRLPLTDRPVRRRMAFRADAAGEVTLTLRAVEPGLSGAGDKAQASYAAATASPAGLRVGDLYVGAMGFKGPNLLLDEGPRAPRAPAGSLECTVLPWTGGSHLVRTAPYPCVQSAARMVNGRIAGEESAWGPSVSGAAVDHATGVVRFKRPQKLTSIAVYEDNSGPVLSGKEVREKAAARYGIYVRKAGTRELTYLGHVSDNTQLINVFLCPPEPLEEIHYLWAGRADADTIDGPVRMAEIEAYADEMGLLLDTLGDGGDESRLNLGL